MVPLNAEPAGQVRSMEELPMPSRRMQRLDTRRPAVCCAPRVSSNWRQSLKIGWAGTGARRAGGAMDIAQGRARYSGRALADPIPLTRRQRTSSNWPCASWSSAKRLARPSKPPRKDIEAPAEREDRSNVIDLMEALRQSVKGKKAAGLSTKSDSKKSTPAGKRKKRNSVMSVTFPRRFSRHMPMSAWLCSALKLIDPEVAIRLSGGWHGRQGISGTCGPAW